ncbi:hypothetical protein ISN75_14000 [Dyella marensis]|uniref:hypothetical protein n=1 Tax=Dyella marensis TaxID=500610 RepID=UPI0031D18BD4
MNLGLSSLFVVFVVLKLTKVITWSWWWIASPLWIAALLWLLIVGIAIWSRG